MDAQSFGWKVSGERDLGRRLRSITAQVPCSLQRRKCLFMMWRCGAHHFNQVTRLCMHHSGTPWHWCHLMWCIESTQRSLWSLLLDCINWISPSLQTQISAYRKQEHSQTNTECRIQLGQPTKNSILRKHKKGLMRLGKMFQNKRHYIICSLQPNEHVNRHWILTWGRGEGEATIKNIFGEIGIFTYSTSYYKISLDVE